MSKLAALALVGQVTSKAMIGTNIGGWLVLEPWITPSLFYRYLGLSHNSEKNNIGIDSYTVCESLGPEEGNKVMRAHWDSWYTEDHIKQLADRKVEMVRLPIGDWTLDPYGPYVGCMDGAADKIQWMLDTCEKYGIKVLMDVHAVKGSQNGFDNSGQTKRLEWIDDDHFKHWSVADANWQGEFKDGEFVRDQDNFNRSVQVSEDLLKKWGSHPAFGAFEPVNEPWWNSDYDYLKQFYREVRPLVQKYAPQAYFVFHDGFSYDGGLWNDLFEDTDKVVLDHHYYQAFNYYANGSVKESCDQYNQNSEDAKKIKFDVWIGEWALATDVCATWLGGFNDGNNNPDTQGHACNWVECPYSYLPEEVDTDFDRTADILGPYGEMDPKHVAVHSGKCSTDSKHFSYEEVQAIAKCALDSFDANIQGQFLWTAHNEIEAKWDYVRAWDLGWINTEPLEHDVDKEEMYKVNPEARKEAKTERITFLQ